MKFISNLLLTAGLAISASAKETNSKPAGRKLEAADQNFPATVFGPGCLNFQHDGSWAEVPDFAIHGPFVVQPESPFRFSSGTRFPDEAVRVDPAGGLVATDNDWILDIFDTTGRPGTHKAWYKSSHHGKFATTWHSKTTIGLENKENTFQIVLSEGAGGDMGEGNNICFCYGDMQWGPGKVRVTSPASSDHGEVDYFGGNFADASDIDSLDNKSCCFNADKLKALGSNVDFANLCHARATEVGSNGDPHFKTWKNEHFEYHGQCDLVLTKDPGFANGLGMDVHIRTKLVRHWSYIKNVVIRMGNDILEIQGSAVDYDPETHYWINYQYQGELAEFAGFPVKMLSQKGVAATKNRIEIDLGSVHPGQKIVLSTFKEFVKVAFVNASEEAFGNTVGMLGDFQTGKTFARDGVTVLDDFTELGHEWQVLPSDGYWFHEGVSVPQFPAKCIDPEDPRGVRRRLDESDITEEEAQAACAGLLDEWDRKDCVYDILATQDLDMAGAY